MHVLANRPFRDLALGQLVLHPRPDPVRRVSLFYAALSGRLPGLHRRTGLPPSASIGDVPVAPDRFADHPPVHTQLLGHPHDRPDPELVRSTDLFE